ncbi:MAG: group 1 truncated hemoglobin [Aestuariibacter sp.]
MIKTKKPQTIILAMVITMLTLLTMSSCTSMQSSETLYEDIGGRDTLVRVYISAVKRIYSDPRINHYFKGVPAKVLAKHLADQTCELIGGPCQYTGRSMLDSHKGMGITDADMFVLVEHVQRAIREVGLSSQQENLIIKQLAPLKSDIVYQ